LKIGLIMLVITKITDDVVYLECSCGAGFDCSSLHKKAVCYNCEDSISLVSAKEDYLEKMYTGSSYLSDLRSRAHRVRNKFYDRYGNIAQLVKRLKLDK
jgi:hypothetical protein